MSGSSDPERSAASERARRSALGGGASPLPPDFYAGPAARVAVDLLGCLLVSEIGGERCVARIVETEAYVGPDDEASHAHRRFGVTPRNDPMFGPPGIAYVYRIYGLHRCLNAVTDPEGYGAAVLIRAAQPVDGIETMRRRRAGRSDRDLLRGPGNLCRALAIDMEMNRHPLHLHPLWIEGRDGPAPEVVAGPRIGISRAVDLPLRFHVRGSPWASR